MGRALLGGCLMGFLLLMACREEKAGETQPTTTSQHLAEGLHAQTGDPGGISEPLPDDSDEFEWYYVVVLDSSETYDGLNAKMYQLSRELGIAIDSMGRGFDRQKNKLVVLPGEDEMYEGAYVPKRFESSELSMEYLYAYREDAPQELLILTAGLFISRSEAEAQALRFANWYPHPTLIRSRMFTGCIH